MITFLFCPLMDRLYLGPGSLPVRWCSWADSCASPGSVVVLEPLPQSAERVVLPYRQQVCWRQVKSASHSVPGARP